LDTQQTNPVKFSNPKPAKPNYYESSYTLSEDLRTVTIHMEVRTGVVPVPGISKLITIAGVTSKFNGQEWDGKDQKGDDVTIRLLRNKVISVPPTNTENNSKFTEPAEDGSFSYIVEFESKMAVAANAQVIISKQIGIAKYTVQGTASLVVTEDDTTGTRIKFSVLSSALLELSEKAGAYKILGSTTPIDIKRVYDNAPWSSDNDNIKIIVARPIKMSQPEEKVTLDKDGIFTTTVQFDSHMIVKDETKLQLMKPGGLVSDVILLVKHGDSASDITLTSEKKLPSGSYRILPKEDGYDVTRKSDGYRWTGQIHKTTGYEVVAFVVEETPVKVTKVYDQKLLDDRKLSLIAKFNTAMKILFNTRVSVQQTFEGQVESVYGTPSFPTDDATVIKFDVDLGDFSQKYGTFKILSAVDTGLGGIVRADDDKAAWDINDDIEVTVERPTLLVKTPPHEIILDSMGQFTTNVQFNSVVVVENEATLQLHQTNGQDLEISLLKAPDPDYIVMKGELPKAGTFIITKPNGVFRRDDYTPWTGLDREGNPIVLTFTQQPPRANVGTPITLSTSSEFESVLLFDSEVKVKDNTTLQLIDSGVATDMVIYVTKGDSPKTVKMTGSNFRPGIYGIKTTQLLGVLRVDDDIRWTGLDWSGNPIVLNIEGQ